MFRQRLKGGHKVGATQQQVPPAQTQGGAASNFSSNSGIANVGWGFGDDWNWDTAEQSNSWAGAGPQQPSGQYGPKQQHPVQQHPVQQHPVQQHPVQEHLAEQRHPMLQHNLPLQQYAAQQASNPILSQPNDPRIGRSSSQPAPNVQLGLCNQQPNQHSKQHPQQQNLCHPPQQQNNVCQGLYQPQHDAQPCYLKVNPLQRQGTGNANNSNHAPRPQQQGNPNLINNNYHNNNNNVGWSDNWDDWGLQDNVQQQRQQQQQFDHEKQTQQWHQQQHQYEVQPPPPASVEANSKPQQDSDEWGDVWEDMTEDEQQEHLEQQRQLQQQEQQQQKIQQQLQQMQQQQHIQQQVDRQIHSEEISVPAGQYCPFVSEASNGRKLSNGVPDILTQATTKDGNASFTGFNIAEDPVDSTAVESEPKESYSHHYQYSTEETVQLATIGDHEPARPASSEQMVQQNYVASTANDAATGENVAPPVSPVVGADAKPHSTDDIFSTDGGDGWGDQVGWEASPAEPTYHQHQHHLEGGDQERIGEQDFNSSQNQQQHHHTQEGGLHNQGYFNSDDQHQEESELNDLQPISHEICDGEKDGDLIMKASGDESNQQPLLQLDYHSKLNSERGQNYTRDQYQFHQQLDQNAGHFQLNMFHSEEPSEPIDSTSNMETATKDKAVVAPVSGDQSPGDGDGLASMRVTAPPQPSASPAAAPVDEGALDSWDKWNEGSAIEGGLSHGDQATAVSSILLGVTHKDQANAVTSISSLPSTATNNEQVSGSVNGVADVNMQAFATTASTSSSNTFAQSRSSPEQDATTAAVAPSGILAADQMPLGSFLDIELAEHCSQTSVGSSDGLHERLDAIEDQQRLFTHAGSSETHRREETQPSLLHSASVSQQQAHAPWQGLEGEGSSHEQPQQPQLQAEPLQDWQQGWSNDDKWGYSHVGEEHVDSYDGLRSDPQIYKHYDHPALPEHPHVQQESVQHQMDEMELHLHQQSSGLIHGHGLENQMQQLPGTSINQSQPDPIDIEFSHLQSQSSSVHGEVMSVGHQQALSDVSLDHPARPLSSHSNMSTHSHHSSTSNRPNSRGMAASAASHPPSVGSSRPPSVHTPQSDSQAASFYCPAPPTSSSEYKIEFQSQQPGISGPLVDFSKLQTQRVSPETAVTLLDSFPSETPLVSNEVSTETHQPALVSSYPFSSAPSAQLVSTDAAVGLKFDDVTVVSSVPPLSPAPPPPMSAPLPPMSAAPTPMCVPPPPMSAPLMSSAAPLPPVVRPSGSVQNFRARKGSPFQPPSLSKVPASTAFHPSLPLDAVSHSIGEGLDIGNSLDSNALLQATNVTLPNASVRLSVATSEEPIMEPSVHATSASNEGFGTFTVNAVPLVVPSMISNPQMIPTASSSSTVTSDKRSLALGDLEPSYGDGMTEEEQQQLQQQASAPPIAHHLNLTAKPQTPKVRSLASMPSTPNTPTVLNLSVQYSGNQHHASNLLVSNSHDLKPEVVTERSAEDNLRRTDDESDDDNADGEEEDDDSGGVPRFSRMVPGCGSSTADPQPAQPTQPSAAPPPMPTDRVVTGIDNPIAPPSQQMPPPSGVAGSNMSVSGGQSMPPPPPPQQQRTAMHPPKRSATIGSEESGTTSTTQLLQQQQTKPSAASVSSSSPLPSSKQRPMSTSTSSISPPQSPVFDPSYDQASRSRVTTTHHQQKKGRFADRWRNDDYYYGDKGDRYPESRSSRHRHEQGYRDEMARYGDGEGARDYKGSANASSRPYDNRNANSRRHDSSRYYDEDGYYQRSGEGSRSSSLDGGDSYPPSYRSRPHGSGSRTHDGPSRDHSGVHALGEGRSNDPSESRGRNKHMDRRDNSYERRGGDSSSVDHHHRRDKIRDRDGAAGAGDSGDRSDRGDRSSRRDRRDWRDQQAPPAVPPPPRDRDWDRELDSDWERDHPTSRDWERDHPTSRDWERERDREYRRDYIRDYYGRGYPGYGDPYGGKSARDAYDPQHYYYYYYSRYYDQNPKYRDYYNSMLKHYHQQYPLSQPPTSLPDERASVRSGRSSVNDDVKKSALNNSRTSAAPQPLYDPYGLYHHQLQQQQHHLETSSGDVSGRGSVDHVSRSAAQRLTPTLFTRPHTIAQFTATGQIILLLPSDRSSSYNRRGSQDALDDADDAAGTIRIMDVKDVLANNEDVRQELTIIEAFPGPLTRHDTHKDVVVRFCESKHKSFLESCNAASSLDPRQEQLLASQLLLWQYLGLLVRQNGKLCPADLAGLLVDSARERRKKKVKKLEVAASAEELNSQMDRLALEGQPQQQDPDQEQRDDDCASEPSHHHLNSRQDRAGGGFRGSSHSLSSSTNRLSSMLLPGQQIPATSNLHLTALRCLPQLNADELEEVNSRMSELVCLGRRREAIEVAVEHRLWGHAMAIGSRMEQAVGGRVLSAFLQTVASDDVMHTLVQQVNGKRPEVTKSYSVTRWGDWRRHLATLVANPSPQPGKDQAAMMALGDTLAGAGDIAAGHLCYLIGGGVSAWGQKLHLLGCGQSTEQILATPTCSDALHNIQCSEVYEYGLSLATADLNSTSMTASTLASGAEHRLPGFQQHKLRYAATLAQYGYVQEAVRYCEVIAASISECPDQHPVDLTARLHHLASCLKYHHTHYQLGEGEPQDMPDPQWLASLQMVLYEQQQQMLLRQQQLQESVVEGSNQVMAAAQDDHQKIQQSVTNAESAYQTDYNGGVSSAVVLDATSGGEGIKSDYAGEVPPMSADRSDGPSRASFHPQEDGGYDLSEHKPQPALMSGQYVNGTNAASEHSQQPSGLKQEVPDQLEDGSCNNNGDDGGQQQFSFQPMFMPTGHESLGGESAGNSPRGYPPSMGYSASTDNYKRGSLGEVGDGGSSLGGSQQPTPHFTPTHHPQQHQYDEYGEAAYTSLPAVLAPDEGDEVASYYGDASWGYASLPPSGAASTLPPSPSHGPTLQQGDNQHQQQQPNNNSSDVDGGSGKPGNKSGGGSDSGKGGEGGTDKGFLSRIFGWKNNQAKLPDDKNPTIVWDEERKRWVNTDGTDDTDTPPPPPPTAAALPLNSTISRAGPRRSRYVNPVDEKDRVKPSTTITPPLAMPNMMPASMHPSMPQQQMPQKQMQQQIPQQQMLHQMPQQQQMMQPQQQQPNNFGVQQQPMPNAAVQEQPSEGPIEVVPDAGLRTAVGGRTRSDSSSIDLDDAGASQDQDESNAGSGRPMFFNPAQFQQTQQQQQQQASRGRGGRGGPANNIRRGRGGGPQRRSFQGGGAAPPPLPRA